MKFILLDCTNEGILWAGDNQSTAINLKHGLVDAEMRIIYQGNPSYNLVTMHELYEKQNHLCIDKNNSITPLPESAVNAIYLERRRLVSLRYPLMQRLMTMAWHCTMSCKPFIWPGIEHHIHRALDQCDMDAGSWSHAVLEYARISELEPAHAYRELKIQANIIDSTMMTVYSLTKYLANRINSITLEDQVAMVAKEMMDRFDRDTRI